MRNTIIFYLNGERIEVGADEASMMLAEYLRYRRSLVGTKIVCAEGDCGACSVLRYFPHGQSAQFIPINSCIVTVAQLDGSSLVTVDALKKNDELHQVQQAMLKCHGSQCGFCTPGFVMAITGLLEVSFNDPKKILNEQNTKNSLTGNLCRCTGYQSIIDATMSIDLSKCESVMDRFYDEKQKKDLAENFKLAVSIENAEYRFFAPKTVKDALDFLKNNPDTKIIASGTDLGVMHNKRKIQLTKLLSLHLIEELYHIKKTDKEITVGARVTLSDFRNFMKDILPEMSNYLDVFASPQIKNIATLIGNIANASPIADTTPALMALKAKVIVMGSSGERIIDLSDFYLAYKKIDLKVGEVIVGIKFQKPTLDSTVHFFKNANRKDLDISSVNLSVVIDWKDKDKKEIADITIAAGGISSVPLRLKKTEDFFKKNNFNKNNKDQAMQILHSEFTPLTDLRATSSYRHIVLENFLLSVLT